MVQVGDEWKSGDYYGETSFEDKLGATCKGITAIEDVFAMDDEWWSKRKTFFKEEHAFAFCTNLTTVHSKVYSLTFRSGGKAPVLTASDGAGRPAVEVGLDTLERAGLVYGSKYTHEMFLWDTNTSSWLRATMRTDWYAPRGSAKYKWTWNKCKENKTLPELLSSRWNNRRNSALVKLGLKDEGNTVKKRRIQMQLDALAEVSRVEQLMKNIRDDLTSGNQTQAVTKDLRQAEEHIKTARRKLRAWVNNKAPTAR